MTNRYMLYQIAYALRKFLLRNNFGTIPKEDWMQAKKELDLITYHIGMTIKYSGRLK